MREIDGQPFRNLMRGMCKLYSQEADDLLLDAYWLALRNWSLVEFEQAVSHLMANSSFMPRPADFNQLRKAGRPVAPEAWSRARHSCGSAWTPRGYIGGTSGDPLIDKAVSAIGGYAAIAQCETEKLHFLERRFSEVYESIQDADDVRAALPQITNSNFCIAVLNKQLESRRRLDSERIKIPTTTDCGMVGVEESADTANFRDTTEAGNRLVCSPDSSVEEERI